MIIRAVALVAFVAALVAASPASAIPLADVPASAAPAAVPTQAPPPSSEEEATTTGAVSHRRLELAPSRFDDASNLKVPPLVVEPQRSNRDRALVWIGGLLVLAAAFFWARSRRQEIERQEQAASAPAPDRSSKEDR